MAQRKRSQDVTDAELAVLEALWERGAATIRELTDQLYPSGGAAHYATVQKLLERLESKRCVARDRRPGRHVYRARIERGDLIRQNLEDLADRLCDGSLAPLLTSLVQGRRLSAGERRALRELVDELESKRSRRRGQGGAR